MSLIGSVGSIASNPYQKISGMMRTDPSADLKSAAGLGKLGETGIAQGPKESGFGSMFENMIETVQQKQATASDLTKQVLLGENDQMHQSVIAMQEASVAFTLMVEVRNKLVESYQELMRMPV